MIKKRKIREITLLMFKDWKILILIITFDVLFILVLLSLRFIQISLDDLLHSLFVDKGKASLINSIFYVIFEFFLIILVYSFFKYFIIKLICENFKKAEFKLKDFFSFSKLNFIIFTPLIIIFVLVLDLVIMFFNNWLSQGGIDPFKFVFVILIIGILSFILFIFVYTFINVIHFSFFREKNFRKLLKKGIIDSFKINKYKMYWDNFKIVFLFGILLLIIHFFMKSFVLDDFSLYIKYYRTYKIFIYWVISLVIYFLLLFNRFKFHMDLVNTSKKVD